MPRGSNRRRSVIFLYDGNTYEELETPIEFDSHTEAARYYGWRSLETVRDRIDRGYALEPGGVSYRNPRMYLASDSARNNQQLYGNTIYQDQCSIGNQILAVQASIKSLNHTTPNPGNPVRAYRPDGSLEGVYSSYRDCERKLNCNHTLISSSVRNNRAISSGPWKGWRFMI